MFSPILKYSETISSAYCCDLGLSIYELWSAAAQYHSLIKTIKDSAMTVFSTELLSERLGARLRSLRQRLQLSSRRSSGDLRLTSGRRVFDGYFCFWRISPWRDWEIFRMISESICSHCLLMSLRSCFSSPSPAPTPFPYSKPHRLFYKNQLPLS